MKIGLNVSERMTALSLLPKEGNFATLRIIRELGGKLGVSADEFEAFEIRDVMDNGTEIIIDKTGNKKVVDEHGEEVEKIDNTAKKVGVKWNEKGSKNVEIDFRVAEITLVANKLKELEENVKHNEKLKEGKQPKPALEQRHFTLYEKFVLEDAPVEKPKEEKKEEKKEVV